MSTVIEKVALYYPRAMHGDGGVTNSLWLWAESLRRTGMAVEVLYDPALPVSPERSVPAGVGTRAIPHTGRGRVSIPRHLARVLDSHTLLILHSGNVVFNIVAGEVAHANGIPYVVMPHGAYDPHVRAVRRSARAVWEIAERRLLRRALAVHVFFPQEVEHVRLLAPDAATVVAPTAFERAGTRWRREDAGDYVAWLGRYDVRHKGLDRLLDAMALLPPQSRPPLRLHGRDHKDSRIVIRSMVDERDLAGSVSIGGSIEGREKQEFLLHAAAYVHPARWESYGVALVENLAQGVPCLTTTDVNLGQELKRAGAAMVVEGSVDGLARGLAAVTRGELSMFSGCGREFVGERLSHETAGRTFLSGIEALAAVGP